LEKVHEELLELEEAKSIGNHSHIEEEFGDLLFSIVNLSRFLQLNAENSLTNATNKFINRFVDVERLAEQEGRHLYEMSIASLRISLNLEYTLSTFVDASLIALSTTICLILYDITNPTNNTGRKTTIK
jgi:hypothetical protein